MQFMMAFTYIARKSSRRFRRNEGSNVVKGEGWGCETDGSVRFGLIRPHSVGRHQIRVLSLICPSSGEFGRHLALLSFFPCRAPFSGPDLDPDPPALGPNAGSALRAAPLGSGPVEVRFGSVRRRWI